MAPGAVSRRGMAAVARLATEPTVDCTDRPAASAAWGVGEAIYKGQARSASLASSSCRAAIASADHAGYAAMWLVSE